RSAFLRFVFLPTRRTFSPLHPMTDWIQRFPEMLLIRRNGLSFLVSISNYKPKTDTAMRYIELKWTLWVAVAIFALSSCKSDLENVPIENQTLEQVFDTNDSAGTNANRFLTDCYRYLPNTGNRVGGDFLDAGTDDAVSSNPTNTSVQQLALGTYTDDSYPDNRWSDFYTGIRIASIFIQNIDRVPLKGQLSNGTPLKRV